MKIVSNWIDAPKVRKEIYEFNQAVKQVYTHYAYLENGIAVPMTMNCIKSRPLMEKSFFTRTAECFTFMKNSVVDVEELNKALKEKCYLYGFNDKTKDNMLSNADISITHTLGRALTQNQIDDIENCPGLVQYKMCSTMTPILKYKLMIDDIAHINNYEAIDLMLGEYKGVEVSLTAVKELFPMSKKVLDIFVYVYEMENLPENTFGIMISSFGKTWTFYSCHTILVDNGRE
jgi:hypothetical protein